MIDFNELEVFRCYEFAVVTEEFLGGIVHLILFDACDLIKGGSVLGSLAIFHFGEKNFIFFDGNEVDFVSFGFKVTSDYSVSL